MSGRVELINGMPIHIPNDVYMMKKVKKKKLLNLKFWKTIKMY